MSPRAKNSLDYVMQRSDLTWEALTSLCRNPSTPLEVVVGLLDGVYGTEPSKVERNDRLQFLTREMGTEVSVDERPIQYQPIRFKAQRLIARHFVPTTKGSPDEWANWEQLEWICPEAINVRQELVNYYAAHPAHASLNPRDRKQVQRFLQYVWLSCPNPYRIAIDNVERALFYAGAYDFIIKQQIVRLLPVIYATCIEYHSWMKDAPPLRFVGWEDIFPPHYAQQVMSERQLKKLRKAFWDQQGVLQKDIMQLLQMSGKLMSHITGDHECGTLIAQLVSLLVIHCEEVNDMRFPSQQIQYALSLNQKEVQEERPVAGGEGTADL